MIDYEKTLSDIVRVSGLTPLANQQDIFRAVMAGTDNLQIEAVAGSGKTTTIRNSLRFIPSNESVLFVAFNRHIADELCKGIPANVSAKTLNGFGWSVLLKTYRGCKLSEFKTYGILHKLMGEPAKGNPQYVEFIKMFQPIKRLVSLFKGHAFGTKIAPLPDRETIDTLAAKFDVELPESEKLEQMYTLLDETFKQSIAMVHSFDYDDQIFMPIAKDLAIPTYDRVFVDESQDLNPVQIHLVRAIARKGRAVFVGDSHQAIYGFRGADPDAMAKIAELFNVRKLPLSVSFRCPIAVVEAAKQIVPQIEAAPNAKQGAVTAISKQNFLELVKVNDYVLCRTTAPLVIECMAQIRKGKKAIVLGRDIGKSLVDMLEKIAKYGSEKGLGMVEAISAYGDSLVENLANRRNADMLIQKVQDQTATLLVLTEDCNTYDCVISKIEQIFSDKASGIIFATIHKAKGLESKNIYILRPEQLPHPMAKQEWAIQQEYNLKYVAYTRAMENLYIVNSEE